MAYRQNSFLKSSFKFVIVTFRYSLNFFFKIIEAQLVGMQFDIGPPGFKVWLLIASRIVLGSLVSSLWPTFLICELRMAPN